MMRKLFIYSTGVFWLAVLSFWLADYFMKPMPIETTFQVKEHSEKHFTLTEINKHNRQTDCWMLIDKQVYDVSKYLPSHPSNPDFILPWCGKEASQAWETKTIGRPHSPRAHQLLEKYLVGTIDSNR